jgi:hypothetical protein
MQDFAAHQDQETYELNLNIYFTKEQFLQCFFQAPQHIDQFMDK